MAGIFKFYPAVCIFLVGCFYNPPIIISNDSTPPIQPSKIKPQENFVIKGQQAKNWRSDPFESFVKNETKEIPASQFALNIRLAPYPKQNILNYEMQEPLPNLPRRITGIMLNNGSIAAILETNFNGQIIHNYITPGSKVFSGSNTVPYLIVDSITRYNLKLKSPDNRFINVNLSGASPEILNYLKQNF